MDDPTLAELVSAFADPPNVAVFTTESVLSGAAPLTLVTHEFEDGAWQFLSGDIVSDDDVRIVALRTIVKMDATIVELADLPMGWMATRLNDREPWTRRKQTLSTLPPGT